MQTALFVQMLNCLSGVKVTSVVVGSFIYAHTGQSMQLYNTHTQYYYRPVMHVPVILIPMFLTAALFSATETLCTILNNKISLPTISSYIYAFARYKSHLHCIQCIFKCYAFPGNHDNHDQKSDQNFFFFNTTICKDYYFFYYIACKTLCLIIITFKVSIF